MIDAHHHLWHYSAADYPWIPAGTALAQDHLLAELNSATASAGVDGTVVVQARQTLEESDWLLSLADESPLIRGVVGWVPLVEKEVDRELERLSRHPKFKGVRHILQGEPDEYFVRDDFHRGLALLADRSIPYDLLLFQRQLPAALELVDRQPSLPIIVDHIAKPEIHCGRVEPAWRKGMAELARRDQVNGVKISGMATEVTDADIDEATLRAYFEETLALFGPDRLMFGTDWPVSLLRLDSYKSWAEMVVRFVAPLSAPERQAILHGNAIRIYNLDSNDSAPASAAPFRSA